MNQRKIIVAIDGYSSCGKSTIAKELARRAGYKYVDTGAMYRAVALFYLRAAADSRSVSADNLAERVTPMLKDINISFCTTSSGQHTLLNGEDVEKEIRTLEVGNMASQVSTIGAVRRFLVEQQQAMGREGGIVMDGRDIGTVVFPNAELKLFLTASPKVRAERRYKELIEKEGKADFEAVLRDVEERDYRDTHRAESPLRQAEDAIVVDNSCMTPDEQMQTVMKIFGERVEC